MLHFRSVASVPVLFAAVAICAACSLNPPPAQNSELGTPVISPPASEQPPSTQTDVALATVTQSPSPTAMYAASAMQGTLRLDRFGCVQLETEFRQLNALLWPWGYTARRVGTETEVLTSDGHIIGRTGEHIVVGGAARSLKATDVGQRCLQDTTQVFEVNPFE